jgi:hypothetical protein
MESEKNYELSIKLTFVSGNVFHHGKFSTCLGGVQIQQLGGPSSYSKLPSVRKVSAAGTRLKIGIPALL